MYNFYKVKGFIKPYDDDKATYDIEEHRYILTLKEVKNKLGTDLEKRIGTTEESKFFLDEISEDIYRHITRYSNIHSYEIKEYYISCTEEFRAMIIKAMLRHVRYASRSGGNLLKDQHGINIESGKVIELNVLRGRVELSSASLDILQNSGIMYTGYIRPILTKEFVKGVDY